MLMCALVPCSWFATGMATINNRNPSETKVQPKYGAMAIHTIV